MFAFRALQMGNSDLGAQTADAIVVLTGGLNRIDEGLELFAAGKGTYLFISGVHKDVRKKDIMDRWQGDVALPSCCLTLGATATTTVENAQETKDWAMQNDIMDIILVTSNYHMSRARMEIKAVLPRVEIFPYPIMQDNLHATEPRIWKLLFEEYHKLLLRFVQLIFSF